jgi:hypothetical protein
MSASDDELFRLMATEADALLKRGLLPSAIQRR